MNKILPVMRMVSGAQFSRRMREQFKICAQNRKRNPDEGGLLVEVLVGMLILVIVFTATTIALSSMADQRVRIEQRDRALKIATTYDELSKTFRCGFVVDRYQDSLVSSGDGTVELQQQVNNCDFAAIEDGSARVNAGDQDFVKIERISENNNEQRFDVKIRYWWEWPGLDGLQNQLCSQIAATTEPELPLILTRAIVVSWTERGVPRKVSIIKRDPAPNNDVVFASGNRVTLLVRFNGPSPVPSGTTWEARLTPDLANTDLHIKRVVDSDGDRIEGQPTSCITYAYITPDNEGAREFSARVNGALVGGIAPYTVSPFAVSQSIAMVNP